MGIEFASAHMKTGTLKVIKKLLLVILSYQKELFFESAISLFYFEEI